jgi:hypothetical protein
MKAFPSAEGFGANSVGGRGGVVLAVTKLTDDGTVGTFRWAVNQAGPRTVIFRVDGTIALTSAINIWYPYLTIACQTAPGMGIQFKNYGIYVRTHDVIVRFLRSRPGLDVIDPAVGMDTNCLDVVGFEFNGNITPGSAVVTNIGPEYTYNLSVGMVLQADAYLPWPVYIQSIDSTTQITMTRPSTTTSNRRIAFHPSEPDWRSIARNIIFDHCSLEWANDQIMDAYGDVQDISFQWCLVGECLNIGHSILEGSSGWIKGPNISHSTGGLLASEPFYGPTLRVSLHHCCYAHNGSRLPLINTFTNTGLPTMQEQVDMRNNLIYNWSGDGGGSTFTNAFYSASQWTEWKSVVGWPTNGAIQVNLIGNHYIEGPLPPPYGPNPNSGVGWVSDCTKLHAANNLYWPGGGYANIGPIDGFGVKINRADPVGVSNAEAHLWAKWPNYDPVNYTVASAFNFYGSTYPTVTTVAVGQVYELVLQNVGASKVKRNGVWVSIRDSLDTRLIGTTAGVGGEVRTRTGSVGGTLTYAMWTAGQNLTYPTLTAGSPELDSNGDGVPDSWATTHGFSVNTDLNLTYAPSGYTYLENYINELAGDTVDTPPPVDTTPPAAPTNVFVS